VVDVYVNYLRKKLSAVRVTAIDDSGEDRVIETVRGEGYMMAAEAVGKKACGMVTRLEWERGSQASA
jgi:DNA-binding winged helix-turn-helix (wHTH) protein